MRMPIRQCRLHVHAPESVPRWCSTERVYADTLVSRVIHTVPQHHPQQVHTMQRVQADPAKYNTEKKHQFGTRHALA